MTVDRRRHRIRGLLSRLSWPLRRKESIAWTEQDQQAYDWEIVWLRRERR